MPKTSNLSPSHRPSWPSLNNGPIQRRVRRAFLGTGSVLLSTSQLLAWTYPRPTGNRHNHRRSIRRVAERYCERAGRGTSVGRPVLWRLRPEYDPRATSRIGKAKNDANDV
jgi:hypothetical protein